jgi:hypothetical protein
VAAILLLDAILLIILTIGISLLTIFYGAYQFVKAEANMKISSNRSWAMEKSVEQHQQPAEEDEDNNPLYVPPQTKMFNVF